jgi:hypothetical protein
MLDAGIAANQPVERNAQAIAYDVRLPAHPKLSTSL